MNLLKKKNEMQPAENAVIAETAESAKVKYGIGRRNFFGQGAMILLALAAIFRLLGSLGQELNAIVLSVSFLLPAAACILYLLCVCLLGRKGFFLSFIPVLLGAIFFVYRALSCGDAVKIILYILAAAVIAVVYTCTMFGVIRTKWILPPLFAAAFAFELLKDLPAIAGGNAAQLSFVAGMQEMAVLCILLGMFFASLGIRKRQPRPVQTVEGEAVEVPPCPPQEGAYPSTPPAADDGFVSPPPVEEFRPELSGGPSAPSEEGPDLPAADVVTEEVRETADEE